MTKITEADEAFLRRAIALATASRAGGDAPYGSIIVDGSGEIVQESHNTVLSDDDITAHPELKLARWSAQHLGADAASATMYTSTQPCQMWAGAIERSGLGRVVFALSGEQSDALRTSTRQTVDYDGPALYDEALAAVAGFVE
jgi:tRNA(Arg) A34 adenosine deaminase TadA